jgi:hypothetical protein
LLSFSSLSHEDEGASRAAASAARADEKKPRCTYSPVSRPDAGGVQKQFWTVDASYCLGREPPHVRDVHPKYNVTETVTLRSGDVIWRYGTLVPKERG